MMACPVEIQMQGGFMSVSASMQPVNNLITAAETAGKGYKLTAIFLPVNMTGKNKGHPLDGYMTGLTSSVARAMCIFQASPNEPDLPVETMFLQAPIVLTTRIGGQTASGYEGLYGQLQQAAQQGFPLCSVIDEPNARMNGLRSAETTVHLICQRRQGQLSGSKTYQIVNCPISMQAQFGGCSASMPMLMQTLQAYASQGYKVASIYNPPTLAVAGIWSGESQCHIIFEKAQFNYCFTVVDLLFTVNGGVGSCSVDHNQYLNAIVQYTKQGWELAGLIDMPDGNVAGLMSITSTIKLVFQAQTTTPAAENAGPPIAVQCPQGAAPGVTIQLKHPSNGETLQVQVPEGVKPGDIFQVCV
jgi:hypothetical protein